MQKWHAALGWDASAQSQVSPRGNKPNRCRIPEEFQATSASMSAPLAAFFILFLLGWALCMAHLFVPIWK
jgi:hypothetical protein